MKYRKFGRTGIDVSELVFGGGMVGGLLIEQDDDTRRAAIDRAIGAGINWIDAAAAYGQGRSEEALGWLLADRQEPIHVSTKFTIDTRDLADLAGQIEGSLSASLERLRRDSVTVVHLHNRIGAETSGRTLGAAELLRSGGVFDALDRLREQGLFDHYGITALGDTPSILRVIESGRIASAQVYYNLLNPSAGRALPAAWPVFDFAGVIATDQRTGRERPLTPGDTVDSEAAKARAVFRTLGDRYGSRAQTAIRFALAEPRLACVIVGLAEISQLEEALAGQTLGALDAEALAAIDRVYAAGVAATA